MNENAEGKTGSNLFTEGQSSQTQLHDFQETTEMNKKFWFLYF
jgi:hypothetical protein